VLTCMGYVSTRWRGLTFFPPLRKASVPRSSWISKRISLKTLRKLKKPRGKNLSCLALRRKRGFADAKSTAYVRFERADELLRQPSCLRVDFGRNALARSYLLSSFRVRRIKRGLLSFRPQDEATIFVSFCARHVQRGLLSSRPQ
jgi:hypothetical protein